MAKIRAGTEEGATGARHNRRRLAHRRADPQYEIYAERGYVDSDVLLLPLAVVGGTALIALITALSVAALAFADARPDRATVAAGPLICGLGVRLGITVRLVPAWALNRPWPLPGVRPSPGVGAIHQGVLRLVHRTGSGRAKIDEHH